MPLIKSTFRIRKCVWYPAQRNSFVLVAVGGCCEVLKEYCECSSQIKGHITVTLTFYFTSWFSLNLKINVFCIH